MEKENIICIEKFLYYFIYTVNEHTIQYNMAIFTKYGNKIIPNGHWEWPLGIEFLQWLFQPHSVRKDIFLYYFNICKYTMQSIHIQYSVHLSL